MSLCVITYQQKVHGQPDPWNESWTATSCYANWVYLPHRSFFEWAIQVRKPKQVPSPCVLFQYYLFTVPQRGSEKGDPERKQHFQVTQKWLSGDLLIGSPFPDPLFWGRWCIFVQEERTPAVVICRYNLSRQTRDKSMLNIYLHMAGCQTMFGLRVPFRGGGSRHGVVIPEWVEPADQVVFALFVFFYYTYYRLWFTSTCVKHIGTVSSNSRSQIALFQQHFTNLCPLREGKQTNKQRQQTKHGRPASLEKENITWKHNKETTTNQTNTEHTLLTGSLRALRLLLLIVNVNTTSNRIHSNT